VDRRAISVELTAASRELFAPLAPLLRNINAPLLAGISLNDLDTIHRLFRASLQTAMKHRRGAKLQNSRAAIANSLTDERDA
jgi:DNA-binding MarR family transcriptional regulator